MTITQHATLLLVLLVSVQGFWNLNDFVQRYPNLLCNNTIIAQYIEQCPKPSTTRTRTTTTPTFWTTGETGTQSSASTSSVFTIGVTPTTDPTASVETTSATPLEQAHWCRLENGSAFALSYSFMLDPCTVCQCTQTRVIRCTRYPCMTAYCIDNSPPVQRPGQCCAQCAYENNSNTCTVGTTKVPHGTIVRGPTSNGERCWCQMGTIECRRFAALATNGWGLWGDGMVLYLVLILMLILLVVGTLSCVACSVYFYYYYKKQNQVANEEYQQYWNQAGWQPMDADGQVDQKKLEAEQQQQGAGMGDAVAGTDPEYIPPPYAAYNGAYPNERS